jgi:hypothetical protein
VSRWQRLAFRSKQFDPRTIPGIGLWLDASDLSTITLNGSNVSQWRDKSGAGMPAAAQSIQRERAEWPRDDRLRHDAIARLWLFDGVIQLPAQRDRRNRVHGRPPWRLVRPERIRAVPL